MRGRGMTYDTGFFPGGKTSREAFDSDVVRRELQVVADDLHCTAVRITGGDPERLSLAAGHAAESGLEVWCSPFPCEMTPDQMLPYSADCAERAVDLRHQGARIVLVTGCELSLFAAGFIPGENAYARIAAVTSGDAELWAGLRELPARVNAFLAEAAATARKRFGGEVTYAPCWGRTSTGARSTSSRWTRTGTRTTPVATATSCAAASPSASRCRRCSPRCSARSSAAGSQ